MQKNLLTAISSAISAYIELEQLSITTNQQPDTWWLLGQRRQKGYRINTRKPGLIPGPEAWRYNAQDYGK